MQERDVLLSHLTTTISHYLTNGRSVYLDRLGFLIPRTETRSRVRTVDRQYVIREETERTIEFEKCYSLSAYHRETYPDRVEINDLVRRMYPRLPFEFNIRRAEEDVRGLIAALVRSIQRELILTGQSRKLEPVGTLYCLHNRQGSTLLDWFAGADIFLESSYHEVLKVSGPHLYSMPVLTNAWEPFEAAYGAAIAHVSFNPLAELDALDMLDESFQAEEGEDALVHTAVFRKALPGDRHAYLYATDGLRRNALSRGTPKGIEFVFQVLPADDSLDPEQLPTLPARALTMAWVLLHSSKNGVVAPGAGLSAEAPLIESEKFHLTTIVTTGFADIPSPCFSDEGPFSYVNVVGITGDEAAVARQHTPSFLVKLLEHRSIDQITQPNRSSVVTRSGYAEREHRRESQTSFPSSRHPVGMMQ